MMEQAIVVSDLTRQFGTFTAVDHISFDVRAGEIFGFLGANGAGKSTTIRMLCGLLAPSSGTATVGGYDINTQTDLLKRNIGYMSQRFSLYDDLTVEENIRFFGGVYGLSNDQIKKRMAWVMEMASLNGRGRTLAKDLSGGWKQRLALGCAVLHQPRIIFLDEPTGGVDPLSRRKFWELINQLSEEGVTILVTTHYLDEAEYCNSILLINAGRLIARGSPKELKQKFIAYSIIEVETSNVIGAMQLLQSQPSVLKTSVFGTYLHVGVQDEMAGKDLIRRVLQSGGIGVSRMDSIIPSLEDVFLQLLEQPDEHV